MVTILVFAMSFSFLSLIVCLEVGQDFTFFLFAEFGRGLESLVPAGVVMDVETFGAAIVSAGRPKYAEAWEFLAAAGALESFRNSMNPGGVRFHRLCEEGQVFDLMLTDIFVAMGDSCLQCRFSAAKYAVAEELAIDFPALVNAQEPTVGAASVHAADAFSFAV
jgi:hypothetical protein